jgi:hypothetical protein
MMNEHDHQPPIRTTAERTHSQAMQRPTDGQIWPLNRLGYAGPLPQSKFEATQLLDRLIQERRAHPVAGPGSAPRGATPEMT